MATEKIYGIEYVLPRLPQGKLIDGFFLPKKQEKFVRVEIPEIFNELEFDADGNPIYTEGHLTFINRELDRIDHGYWFYNCGVPTYITGLHYFYLNYWTLENGERPEYRECDRRWFLFQHYCEGQSYIDGVIRTKKRREGATSQATADLVKTAITVAYALNGIVSKTGKDASEAFNEMVKKGYNSLPVFLQPWEVEDPDSKTELAFRRQKRRGKVRNQRVKGQLFEKGLGLNSKIDHRNTALNSYDSGRKTKLLAEEGGKWPVEIPINEYWAVVRPTLRESGKRVGFCLMPSTSNKLTKGGKGFKKLWDESDQTKRKITTSGLYRYFCPAWDGFVPYIDEYGRSIVNTPTREEVKWMKEHYGADEEQCSMGVKEYLQYKRDQYKDEDAKNEFIRQYPFNEKEAFDFENKDNIYNLEKLAEQKEYLLSPETKIHFRRVRFFRNEKGKSDFVDDPTGLWQILKLPEDMERWQTIEVNGVTKPANTAKYTVTCDPFKLTIKVGKGSKAGGFIWQKLNPLDPENSGLPIAMYFGRPKLRRRVHEQMLLAAEYYGADLCYESDYDDYIEYLMGEKKMGYAKERPKNTIDPNRKRKPTQKEYGIKSADGFSYSTMIERSVTYVEFHCHKIYFLELIEQLEEYDETERTMYDLAVGFQLGTVAISDPVKPRQADEPRKVPVVKTYNLFSKN